MSSLEETIRAIVRDELARAERERTAASSSDEYLSTGDAAKLADVASGTIRRWIREGKLTEHRAGRLVRIKRADLEEYLRAGGRAVDDSNSAGARARRDFG